MERAPIIVALDGMGIDRASELVRQIGDRVWGFKFNDIYHAKAFIDLASICIDRGAKWWIDLKLHDIPNTVANTVKRVVSRFTPALITVHASGGVEMMKAAVEAAKTYSPADPTVPNTQIVGVTVLTSLDGDSCDAIYHCTPEAQVDRFANLIDRAGCWGVVCSPKEVRSVSIAHPNLKKIVPGIRPEWATKKDDQKRTGTPAQAFSDGADLLVIGRPITEAEDPVDAVEKTAKEISAARAALKGFDVGTTEKERVFDVNHGFATTSTRALRSESDFIFKLFTEVGALEFGEFKLKSGRVSPYFFNAGKFTKSRGLTALGQLYAALIKRRLGEDADKIKLVAGPSYKGVPLAIATAKAMGSDVEYLFDRKEVKEHGDTGGFVGRIPEKDEKIVIVDDVITTGGTKIEFVHKLKGIGADPILVVVALDRQETMSAGGSRSAVSVFEADTGIPVTSIATFDEMIEWYGCMQDDGKAPMPLYDAMKAYREKYGAE